MVGLDHDHPRTKKPVIALASGGGKERKERVGF